VIREGCPQGIVGQLPVEAGHITAHAQYGAHSPDADTVVQISQVIEEGCPQGIVGQLPVEAGHITAHAQYGAHSPDADAVIQIRQVVGKGCPQGIVGQLPVEAGHVAGDAGVELQAALGGATRAVAGILRDPDPPGAAQPSTCLDY
jgi:hypothetical protein